MQNRAGIRLRPANTRRLLGLCNSYVTFSLNALISKIDRLLSQKCKELPGTDCMCCPNNSCAHWNGKNYRKEDIITLPDAEFGQDLFLFFQNLGYVAERTSIMVVEELKNFESNKEVGKAALLTRLDQIKPQNMSGKYTEKNSQ